MSGISLADVLEINSLKKSKILTGKNQLERLITGVTVGEVPDIANWLAGGELVLSTFFAVSRDPGAISSLAKKIINGPAAALAVKPARFLQALPADVLELAERAQFPILEVPADVRWTTIISDVYAAMARANSFRDGEIGNELLRAAIDGRGLRPIVQTVSKKLDAPVVVYDFLDGILAEATTSEPFPKEAVPLLEPDDIVNDSSRPGGFSVQPMVRNFKVDGNYVFSVNIMVGLEVVAVVAAAVPDTLDEVSINFLKRAAEASAVEIARSRAIEEAQLKVYGDFLNDLIAGRIPQDQISTRLARLGGEFSKGFRMLYCTFEPGRLLNRLYREILRFIRIEAAGSLMLEHDEGIAIMLSHTGDLVNSGSSKFVSRIAARVKAIADALHVAATIGISRRSLNPTEIIKALDEAKIALDVGQRLNGPGSETAFDQVGIYRLLLPLAREAKDDGRIFYEETVGLLAEYDKRNGAGFVQTLESFRKNNENVALTAEELYTHRHTVRYRLQRIADITGCDPFKGVDREKLYMGLYVKYLLNL